MFSKFFIERPIFATVLAMIIVVAGIVTLGVLPIAQYPDITPPTVQVSASYPGANAQTVAQTVGIPIEQQVNGVDGTSIDYTYSKNIYMTKKVSDSYLKKKQTEKCILTHTTEKRRISLVHKELIKTNTLIE